MGWTAERPDVLIVHARLYDDSIMHVAVEVEGGADVTIPVVAGHALDVVPKDAHPMRIIGRDINGHEVATFDLR